MVVAPATANTLAKMANGIADNLLTSMFLAFGKTVVVAPAMNTNMWEHPATQKNVAALRDHGVFVVEPGSGELACGDYGSGRMAEPNSIVAEVKLRLQVQRKRDLRGLRVLITAGGTREPIDAVRFIGNRSSGKMGFALARAAFDRGAKVDLIEANVDMPAVPGVREIETPTAGEMHERGHQAPARHRHPHHGGGGGRLPGGRWADRRQGRQGPGRVGHRAGGDHRHPVDVAKHREGQYVVGFAAEYGLEALDRAREKMERKSLDMIVFNDISRTDIGFDSDFNEVRILTRDSEVLVEKAPKETVAEIILDNIALAVRTRRVGRPVAGVEEQEGAPCGAPSSSLL